MSAPDPASLSLGTVLQGRYEILRELGAGGSATAYLVHDRRWDTEVALKLLRSTSAELVEVLRGEFARLRQLYHPSLCHVHELGWWTDAGARLPYFTADFVSGATLARFAEGRDWEAIRGPLGDALGALDLLHRAGLLHGDFKPENILVRDDGSGTLIDLSCAWPAGARPGGVARGTPGYLAPELLAGAALDARSDLFAVGVTFGQLETVLAERLPPPIAKVAQRLRDPDPAGRPSSVGELFEAAWPDRSRGGAVPAGLGKIVGRDAELSALRAAIEALATGRAGARVLHLAGPAGIGKSRLLSEAEWLAQGRTRVIAANPNAPRGVRTLLEEAVRGALPAGDADAVVRARERLLERAEPCALFIDDADRLAGSESVMLGALARSLVETDPVLVVVASPPALCLAGPALRRLELSPLGLRDVHALIGRELPRAACEHLHRLSGGHPGELRTLLLAMAAGRLNESELVRDPEAHARPPGSGRALGDFAPATRAAIGLLAILGKPVAAGPLADLGVRVEHLDPALLTGDVVREAAAYRLANPRDAARWLAELGGDLARALELRVAESCSTALAVEHADPDSRAELAARVALHLARGGEIERAAALLSSRSDEHAMAPQAWLSAAQAIASRCHRFDVELATARLEQMAGLGHAAHQRLEHLIDTGLDAGQRWATRFEIGACLLRIGDARGSVRELRRAVTETTSSAETARVADLLAQALCRQGAYEEAVQVADDARAGCTDARHRADLDETAGVALGCLGRFEAAQARFDAAASVAGRSLPPRHLVRAASARALAAFQTGRLKEASERYAEALSVAERHGLGDQLASASLNLGTVHHQRGAWADALACYERGLRLAVALGQATTEAHARLNLARAYVDIGAPQRAAAQLEACETLARDAGLSSIAASALAVHAELALEDRGPQSALALLERAHDLAESGGDARDLAEIEIRAAELALLAGDLRRAGAQIERCGERVARLDARDVAVRADLATARWLQAERRPREAVPLAEGAQDQARRLELADLQAEAELLTSELWQSLGSDLLAAKHRRAALELWERAAAELLPELRDGFWRCRRRAAARAPALGEPSAGVTLREHKLRLLVEIFRRLNSSLRTEEVLQRAMDAAIELTGAERGFLLRARSDAGRLTMSVAVARNVDREELEHSHSKFSRAIADQVMASGQPVVTACAQTDERFAGNASVHALRLESVLCVPVTSPAGRLGALYLDNRFRTQRFSEQDVDLVLAFADQVAIALGNATLHQALQQKNRELLAQSRRIEELLHEREAEVERLTEQAQRQRPPDGRRYDYGAIVGASPALERIFDLLDRVIDTDLTLLIEGESGTGKELIARAIHQNCAARSGPLVSINCAAVPESLLEAELFGYARGAFTGADTSRDGLFVQAQGGTLFLDELAEMPLSMQVKLLRVLQEREVRPLGSTRTRPIDVRLVCATNRHLPAEVAQGRFREDLYYRVSGVSLRLPALRERPEDLPLLVDHLLRRAAERMHRPVPEVSRAALAKLARYSWPGNIRQLENVVTRALVMTQGDRIGARDLELSPEPIAQQRPLDREGHARHEAQIVANALAEHRWNVAKVARVLGVSRPTLYRRMQAYGMKRKP